MIIGRALWVAGTNTWIVSADNKECVIIDCPPDPDAIVDLITQYQLRPKAIIATHGHVDHTGGIRSVSQYYPSSHIYRHPEDAHYLRDPLQASGMLREALRATGLDLREPELIEDFGEGDHVKGAGMDFRALHTPGHTPGSICIMASLPEGDVLFTGDHLFKGSIGRTDLPGGSSELLMESMRTKILPLADDLPVYPGHGETTTIGKERTTNPYLINQ
ncbi:MBL fold metallo-hydrolase [Ferrimicrobium sp.]|uniref:MBL fold metallo-hydrolase n=1 Tax=Ferrimicrobium sp. TaxID=2926050 RepID=UPI002624865D|nr:MBL fold metallo-hydrolase [Ferrimicrobium sp.]